MLWSPEEIGLTISYEKWVYSLILTPHHSLQSHHLHHITHPRLAATLCLAWNMTLLFFPPVLSRAKYIYESLAFGSMSGAKATPSSCTLALGLWVWQMKSNLFRGLSLPLQKLTHFEVNLYNYFLFDLEEIWKLSAVSAEMWTCSSWRISWDGMLKNGPCWLVFNALWAAEGHKRVYYQDTPSHLWAVSLHIPSTEKKMLEDCGAAMIKIVISWRSLFFL